MNVLIFGHSFIHRLNTYLHQSQSPPALNSEQYKITCIGKGGACLSGTKYNHLMHTVHQHLTTTNTHAIYIALGTNDLQQGTSPYHVAQALFTLACKLKAAYHPRYVYIDQILHRDHAKFPGFHRQADQTNSILQQLIGSKNPPGIKLWKHRNFTNPTTQLLSKDGTHFNQAGMVKYWRSVRGAVLYAGHY